MRLRLTLCNLVYCLNALANFPFTVVQAKAQAEARAVKFVLKSRQLWLRWGREEGGARCAYVTCAADDTRRVYLSCSLCATLGKSA